MEDKMSRRDTILTTLEHKEPKIIPHEVETYDIVALKKFLPKFDDSWREETLKRLEFLDNSIVDMTPSHIHESAWIKEAHNLLRVQGSPSSCGAGFLRTSQIEENEEYVVIEFETKGRWKIYKEPFRRDYIDYPIKIDEDLEKLESIDIDNPERYKGVQESAKFFKEKGYFTSAEIYGFFTGVWYRYYKFEDYLMDFIRRKTFIRRLVDLHGKMNLNAAKNYLERGVDSIYFCDDLGDNRGLLISPEAYKKVIYPWHKRIADLCHQYGAFCHMHSHGNINKIMAFLVKAGIDILNPLDPQDGMNLRDLKDRYGKKMTFLATTTRSIENMSKQEIEELVKERINEGKPGGGFILHLGGITPNVDKEKFDFYLDVSKSLRSNFQN